MIINFNNLGDKVLKEKISILLNIAREYLKCKDNISVNITIVGKQSIRQLNNEFRQVDKVTDVLSFPLLAGEEFLIGEIKQDNVLTDIGDIVICKSRASEQAKQYGHSYLREMCFLSLHGFLHLMGFDHIKKEDEKIMFSLQDTILNKASIER